MCTCTQVVTLSSLLTTVNASYSRLLLELLGILESAGFITAMVEPPTAYRSSEALGSGNVREALVRLATGKIHLEAELVPDLATNVKLVWLCAQALPDIMTGALSMPYICFAHANCHRAPPVKYKIAHAGSMKVTDVMFPGGSPDLVEPIYKNLKLSAPFNAQLAADVRLYVEDRLTV